MARERPESVLLVVGDSLPVSLVATLAGGLGVRVLASTIQESTACVLPACPERWWLQLSEPLRDFVSARIRPGTCLDHGPDGAEWIDAAGYGVRLRQSQSRPCVRKRGSRWRVLSEPDWRVDLPEVPGRVQWIPWNKFVWEKRGIARAEDSLLRVQRGLYLTSALRADLELFESDIEIIRNNKQIRWKEGDLSWQYVDPIAPGDRRLRMARKPDLRDALIRGSAWWYDIFYGILEN